MAGTVCGERRTEPLRSRHRVCVCAERQAARHNEALHVAAGGRLALARPGVFVYYHACSLGFCSRIKHPASQSVRPLGLNCCFCWKQFKGFGLLQEA